MSTQGGLQVLLSADKAGKEQQVHGTESRIQHMSPLSADNLSFVCTVPRFSDFTRNLTFDFGTEQDLRADIVYVRL